MWTLKIEIDAWPIALYPGECVDYAGNFISHQLDISIFEKPNKLERFLIKNLEASTNSLSWNITLNDNLFWSDGRPITTRNVALAFDAIKEGRTANLWLQSILDSTAYTVVSEKHITINLAHPIGSFESILSEVFTPIPDETQEWNVSSGPYSIKKVLADKQGLILEKTFNGKLCPDGPDYIFFIKTSSGEEGMELFENNMIDVTANTVLPLSAFDKYNYTNFLHKGTTNIIGQLKFNPERSSIINNLELRQKIARGINLGTTAKKLKGTINQIKKYTDLWIDNSHKKNTFSDLGHIAVWDDPQENIEILYADFYPNGIIVEELITQIKQLTGVSISAKPASYEDYYQCVCNDEYDLLYALQVAPYNNPLAFMLHHLNDSSSTTIPLEEVKKQLLSGLMSTDYNIHCEHAKKCESLILKEAYSIPLLSVDSLFLANPRISDNQINTFGYIDCINLSKQEPSLKGEVNITSKATLDEK